MRLKVRMMMMVMLLLMMTVHRWLADIGTDHTRTGSSRSGASTSSPLTERFIKQRVLVRLRLRMLLVMLWWCRRLSL
uniref:Putative secreted peptide n=1 Tax=Anopheles braziliensis TaxID=58242 RepID=A0A2M3ZPP9_9DIPT